jgi:hypothetical protein
MERINDREADEAASFRALIEAAGVVMGGEAVEATAVVPAGRPTSTTIDVARVVTTLTTAGLQLAVTIFIFIDIDLVRYWSVILAKLKPHISHMKSFIEQLFVCERPLCTISVHINPKFASMKLFESLMGILISIRN